jgi:hypothetical protein
LAAVYFKKSKNQWGYFAVSGDAAQYNRNVKICPVPERKAR